MRTFLLYLLLPFTILCARAPQYGWKNITVKLPDFLHDTIIIGTDTSIAMMRTLYFPDDLEGWTTPSKRRTGFISAGFRQKISVIARKIVKQ
jgi:hypothetical protein